MTEMNNEPAPENAAELAAFRARWREEVQSRNKNPQGSSLPETAKPQQRRKSVVQPRPGAPGPSVHKKADDVDYDGLAPKPYHDLPDKEEALKLGVEGQEHERAKIFKEPTSALEHYERAVEKETHGQLGDSLKHYRTAFKLDDGVHESYKKKHFPTKPKPAPTHPNPSNASSTVPNPAHHSLQDRSQHTTQPKGQATPSQAIPATLKQLVDEFSQLQIEPAPPETDYSPQKPCPLAEIPEEILTHILLELAVSDVAAFARTAQVCKRMAYLVLTEESIWKRVALGNEFGFAAMHYDYATTIEGKPLEDSDDNDGLGCYLGSSSIDEDNPFAAKDSLATRSQTYTSSLIPQPYPSWHQLFRSRPRIRFNGCYISTVNYNRPGAHSSNSLAWGAPVLVVTYFRYLRFFRDGTVISLLTTTEPGDVVHHLTKENLDNTPANALPGSVMKDALKGRWRLSGPVSSPPEQSEDEEDPERSDEAHERIPSRDPLLPYSAEPEGDVHVETQGVVPRYTYKMLLGLGHAGKQARNNKLSWKGFWSYNRLSDDWGEFALRNDKAFYWSRVRSYDAGA